MLAKRQTTASSRISVRYYLCTDAGPVRLPLRLCRELADRVIALPQFANSIQRMVEVLIQTEPGKTKSVHFRSTSTRFDKDGKIDLHHAAETMAVILGGSKPKRISENVVDMDLRWDQIDFASGTLHVRRVKQGTPSTHPIKGDELRALRRLQREQEPKSPFVFTSERGAPSRQPGSLVWSSGQGPRRSFASRPTPTCCVTPAASR